MRGRESRRHTFGVLTVLFLLSRAADAGATYLVTPDLRHETNPLVSVFGAGWGGLVVVQVVLSALVIWLTYWDLLAWRPHYPKERGLGFREFAEAYYFGRESTIVDFLWRPPTGWRLNLKVAGYALPRLLMVLGFGVAVSSVISLHSDAWRGVLRATSPWIFLVPTFALALWSIYGFLRREYECYVDAA